MLIAPKLGVGIVYIPGVEQLLDPGLMLVDVIELEPQTLFVPRRKGGVGITADALGRLRSFPQPKIIHSVGHPVGTALPDPFSYLPSLIEVRNALNSAWVSEHLGFNRTPSGANLGFVLPLLQTANGVQAAARHIKTFQEQLGAPLAIEFGANYLSPYDWEIPDGRFLADVVEAADCGILLDLHNVWTNDRNGRQSIEDFLRDLPLNRVWEIHLAGGFEMDGYWLDAHSGDIPAEVAALGRDLVPDLANLGAVVYELLAPYLPRRGLGSVARNLEIAKELWERRRAAHGESVCATHSSKSMAGDTNDLNIEPPEWELSLAHCMSETGADVSTAVPNLNRNPGWSVIRKIAWGIRAGMIIEALGLTSRALALTRGEPDFQRLLDTFFRGSNPEFLGVEEALRFAAFLRDQVGDDPFLMDVLDLECATIASMLNGQRHTVDLGFEPTELVRALREGRLPPKPDERRYVVNITPHTITRITGSASPRTAS